MKRRFPFHPLLFAAYPVLQLYSFNAFDVPFSDMPLALVCSMALACLVAGLAWLLLRDLRKAAIFASLFSWFFFSWANMHLALRGVKIGHFHMAKFWLIGVLFLATLLLAALALWRTRSDLLNLTRILNAVGAFFVVSCAGMFAIEFSHQAKLPALPETKPIPVRTRAVGPGPHPDIYFILLDQYPRSDSLRQVCGGDNTAFLKGLKDLGFFVADRSASNYPRTAMSLASMLNMTYLDEFLGDVKEDCQELGFSAAPITHNRVFQFVHERGYQTVYLPPEYGAGRPEDVDIRMESGVRLSEFNQAVIEMTPLAMAMEWLGPRYSVEELHRRHVLFTLESLRKLPRKDLSPFLVYAHILCPHPPVVWGANGEKIFMDLPTATADTWMVSPEGRRAYADQTAYISKLVLETVSAIIAGSKQPPVIILCSDHGTDFEVDWTSVERSNLPERMANLAAFYVPGGADKLFQRDDTNVNFFRILFDHCFGTEYGRLPNKSWFSTLQKPYKFILVPMDAPLKSRPH